MRIVRHPLVDQDLAALVDHIVEVTGGDFDAAGRRLDEVDDLIADISANSMSGVRFATAGRMAGPPWRPRPSSYRRVARRSQQELSCRTCCLGGQGWMTEASRGRPSADDELRRGKKGV
jgi:hypothetical protein